MTIDLAISIIDQAKKIYDEKQSKLSTTLKLSVFDGTTKLYEYRFVFTPISKDHISITFINSFKKILKIQIDQTNKNIINTFIKQGVIACCLSATHNHTIKATLDKFDFYKISPSSTTPGVDRTGSILLTLTEWLSLLAWIV